MIKYELKRSNFKTSNNSMGNHIHCGAQQFADQAHLPLESLKAQSEESCGPSSTTQSTKPFLEAAEDGLVLGRSLIPPE